MIVKCLRSNEVCSKVTLSSKDEVNIMCGIETDLMKSNNLEKKELITVCNSDGV